MNVQTLTHTGGLPVNWTGELQSAPHKRWSATVEAKIHEPPEWQVECERRLLKLLRLPRGWDGPRSGPISASMVVYIRSILSSAMGPTTPAPSFVPGVGGAVQLEWHQNGLDIELMVYRPLDVELSVHYLDGRDPVEDLQMDVNFDPLSRVLAELG